MKVMHCSDGVWSNVSELLCLTCFTALSSILEHLLFAAMCSN